MEEVKVADSRALDIVAREPDPKLSENALRVLQKRYLKKDDKGKVIETPRELFARVAWNLAQAERNYGASEIQVEERARSFFRIMSSLEFLPNSPTLMNAGLELQLLSACFVLPVDDSLVGIFDALKQQALIHQGGGGTGFAFSRLRPKGDFVKSTMGVASGPVSFMKIFDAATQTVKQGGCISVDSLARTSEGLKPHGRLLERNIPMRRGFGCLRTWTPNSPSSSGCTWQTVAPVPGDVSSSRLAPWILRSWKGLEFSWTGSLDSRRIKSRKGRVADTSTSNSSRAISCAGWSVSDGSKAPRRTRSFPLKS